MPVYCPECGGELEMVVVSVYKCSGCGRYWVVQFDSEWGDVYTVTLLEEYAGKLIEKLMDRPKQARSSQG